MSNFIDIYINERKKAVPSFCKICGNILQSLEDTVSAHRDGGCRDCFVSFLEPNRSLKGKEWEPNKKEVKDWLSRKKVQFKPMYKFF